VTDTLPPPPSCPSSTGDVSASSSAGSTSSVGPMYSLLLRREADHVRTGQIAGVSSTEFGLSNMIWAAVVIAKVSAHRTQYMPKRSLRYRRTEITWLRKARLSVCSLACLSSTESWWVRPHECVSATKLTACDARTRSRPSSLRGSPPASSSSTSARLFVCDRRYLWSVLVSRTFPSDHHLPPGDDASS
jgi:hypothetical protein